MKTIVILGVGYVGLPLAVKLAKHFKVIAFDISEKRIEDLKGNFDSNNEVTKEEFEDIKGNIDYTTDEKQINKGDVVIISVPTPVKEDKTPDLKYLESASAIAGKNIKKGAIVVYESTTYPGCTEEFCLEILKKNTKLKYKEDFFIGYSPERINPGDKEHNISTITKIISGDSEQTLQSIRGVYSKITKVHSASSIRIAEAAKVIENVQRDINIALFNELAMIFDKMNLDTKEIFDAAGTKWNFIRYSPGFVGGHCIPVDPYYLAQKAKEINYDPKLILAGRQTSEHLPLFVAEKIESLLKKQDKDINNARILILGATYKENVPDLRDSKVEVLIKSLKNKGIENIYVHERLIESKTIFNVENRELKEKYDVVVCAVPHGSFEDIDIFALLEEKGILIDLKRKKEHLKDELKNKGHLWWGL